MGINLSNFLSSQSKNKRMKEFQDLDHVDGVSISTICANLYKDPRDDLVMFYFRDGANYASVYTQSKIISEKDDGIYDAFNLGMKLAKGEILCFVNSDDKFYSQKTLNFASNEILIKESFPVNLVVI